VELQLAGKGGAEGEIPVRIAWDCHHDTVGEDADREVPPVEAAALEEKLRDRVAADIDPLRLQHVGGKESARPRGPWIALPADNGKRAIRAPPAR
jgi:hypothetical protein